MKSIYFVFSLIIILASCKPVTVGPTSDCNPAQGADNLQHPKNQQIQDLLNAYIQKGVPGISVLLRDSTGAWAGGAGMADIEGQIPFSACTVSKVASITKMFEGVVALQLVQEGKLSLDDMASDWLPNEVVQHVKNLKDCSVRMLMNHTTGIYDVITGTNFYLQLLNNPDHEWSQEELIQLVYDKEPYFKAGDQASYSNTNTLLLSMIIDEASGHDHSIEVQNRILTPLGMTNTVYFPHKNLPGYTAQGYYDLYNNGTIINVSNYHTGSGNGYGGIYSNVFDMQAFIEALFRDKILLSQASLNQMLTFNYPEGDDRGLGLCSMKDFNYRLNKDEFAYGHRGRDLGYSGDLFYFPEKDATLVLLVNYGTNGSTPVGDLYYQLRDDLVDILLQ